jgi:hypothetical protein
VVKLGRQPPFISGASYRHSDADIDETGSLPVPKEMESVVLNRNKTWPEDEFIRIKKPHIDSYDTSEANVGWVFHEVCWIMLEQVDDDYQVMNNNLDLFMIAVHDEITEKREEHTKLIIRAGRNTMWLQRRFKEATVNPFHIPMLGNVTNAALNREVREPELLMPDIRSAAGFRISGGAFYKLRVETQQMIANHIDDEKDFRAFLLATRWRFPSVYWRKRIPECFYEIHKGIGDQQVDWQWLGLEVSRIVEKQYAEVHNRARIYAHIKRLFGYFIARCEIEGTDSGSDVASEAAAD